MTPGVLAEARNGRTTAPATPAIAPSNERRPINFVIGMALSLKFRTFGPYGVSVERKEQPLSINLSLALPTQDE